MRRSVAVLLMTACAVVVAAEEPVASVTSDPRIEDAVAAWTVWVENDLGNSGVPAASYAFVHSDQLLAAGGIGLADPATGRTADADTLYSTHFQEPLHLERLYVPDLLRILFYGTVAGKFAHASGV